ncbi:MAG: M64 family metallopeptidase [Planctomycetota bacterium]
MLSCVLCALLWQVPEAKKLFLDGIEAANRGEPAKAKELFADLRKRFPNSAECVKCALWTEEPAPLLSFKPITRSGPPSRRIDIVALAEAFKATAADQRLFLRDAEKGFGLLFDSEVFREYRDYFNTFAAGIASKDTRVDQFNRTYDTPLEGRKNGDISQVVVSAERVRHFLSGLPFQDGLAYVVVQDEGTGSGGDGIAVLPGEPQREPIMRVCGFGFGNLAEESSSSSYQSVGRPAESVNISSSNDPKLVPWAHWIKALPERVGVYEGGAGAFKGVYRPTADGCVMRGGREFCVVCRERRCCSRSTAASPVDDATPGEVPITIDQALKTPCEIFVQVKEPRSHQDPGEVLPCTARRRQDAAHGGALQAGARRGTLNPERLPDRQGAARRMAGGGGDAQRRGRRAARGARPGEAAARREGAARALRHRRPGERSGARQG